MNCQFLEPVNLGELPKSDWEFSEMNCQIETWELVQNPEYPEREFYVQKTLTYGEAIIVWFLTIFSIFIIAKSILNFVWKK